MSDTCTIKKSDVLPRIAADLRIPVDTITAADMSTAESVCGLRVDAKDPDVLICPSPEPGDRPETPATMYECMRMTIWAHNKRLGQYQGIIDGQSHQISALNDALQKANAAKVAAESTLGRLQGKPPPRWSLLVDGGLSGTPGDLRFSAAGADGYQARHFGLGVNLNVGAEFRPFGDRRFGLAVLAGFDYGYMASQAYLDRPAQTARDGAVLHTLGGSMTVQLAFDVQPTNGGGAVVFALRNTTTFAGMLAHDAIDTGLPNAPWTTDASQLVVKNDTLAVLGFRLPDRCTIGIGGGLSVMHVPAESLTAVGGIFALTGGCQWAIPTAQ